MIILFYQNMFSRLLWFSYRLYGSILFSLSCLVLNQMLPSRLGRNSNSHQSWSSSLKWLLNYDIDFTSNLNCLNLSFTYSAPFISSGEKWWTSADRDKHLAVSPRRLITLNWQKHATCVSISIRASVQSACRVNKNARQIMVGNILATEEFRPVEMKGWVDAGDSSRSLTLNSSIRFPIMKILVTFSSITTVILFRRIQ